MLIKKSLTDFFLNEYYEESVSKAIFLSNENSFPDFNFVLKIILCFKAFHIKINI